MRQSMSLAPATLTIVLAVGAIWLAAVPAEASRPPAGRTYFVTSLGLATDSSEAYDLSVGCIRFTDGLICDQDNDCGTWTRTEWGKPGTKQGAIEFTFDLTDDETGLSIEIDGVARIDARGPRSTLAGVASAREPTSGFKINFGLVGRAVSPARCAALVEAFEAANP